MQAKMFPRWSQKIIIQQNLGKGCEREGMTYFYVDGTTVTETVAKARDKAARWIRYYRKQLRDAGLPQRRFYVKAGEPWRSW